MLPRDYFAISLWAGEQFSEPVIRRCLEVARNMGKTNYFSRVHVDYYRDKKSVSYKMNIHEIDLGIIDFSSIMSLKFFHRRPLQAKLDFTYAPRPQHLLWVPPHLIYYLHEDYIKTDHEGSHLDSFLELFRQWAEATSTVFGYAWHNSIRPVRTGPYKGSKSVKEPTLTTDSIYRIGWANYFGPDLVDWFGRDYLMSTPAWKIEPLPAGGILFLLGKSPLDVEQITDIRLKFMEHLGLKEMKDVSLAEELAAQANSSDTQGKTEDEDEMSDYLNLKSWEIDRFYELFISLAKLGNWEPQLDRESLEILDGFLTSAYEDIQTGDSLIDLATIGSRGTIYYSDLLTAGAGSFIAKLWLKEVGGEITEDQYGSRTDTVIKKGTLVFSPWAWVYKHLANGEEDSVLVKYETAKSMLD